MFFTPQFISRGAAFPLAGAAVDLDFVHNRYYPSSISPDAASPNDQLSCSRASIGYAQTVAGTLTQFSSDTLRITDNGLLVEDARTNYHDHSQDPASWSAIVRTTNTNNFAVAPDGTTTAAKETIDTNSNSHYLANAVSIGDTNDKTLSAYLKSGATNGQQYVTFKVGIGGSDRFTINIDLLSGVVTATTTTGSGIPGVTYGVESLDAGWYRAWIACPSVGDANSEFGFSDSATPTWDGFGSVAYTGDGVSNFYIWGVQTEAGAFASSYIPTTTTAATRAQDVVTCIGALNTVTDGAAASVVVDAIYPAISARPAGYAQQLIGTNVLLPLIGTSDSTQNTEASNYNGSTFLVATLGNSLTWAGGVKAGVSWAAGARSVVGGGGTVQTDVNGFSVTTDMHIGGASDVGPNNQWYGYVRRVTAWSSRLADATLQGFTNP